MIKMSNMNETKISLFATFEDSIQNEWIIKKQNRITEFLNEEKAYIYLGKRSEFTVDSFKKAIHKIFKYVEYREAGVMMDTFVVDSISLKDLVRITVETFTYKFGTLYNEKTDKKEIIEPNLLLIVKDEYKIKDLEVMIDKTTIVARAINFARFYQAMAPNVCNSEYLAEAIKQNMMSFAPSVKVQVLGKKEIEDLGMNLLLSVNKGSIYEPRVVVLEYTGDATSNEKTVIVGKGITFDSGGYNLKPGKFMLGMKYDMSGAIIAAASIRAMAQLNAHKNFSAVLTITDNRINGDANLPDAVWTSMNGKTVEINNTDAEGRLVMADGITYAIRKLNATRIFDIATLTGAITVALGSTFTGVWATEDKSWKEIKKAAEAQNELLWRMPFHSDFLTFMKGSKVADLKNTDYTGKGGSISAAMFLKEFTENKDYVHFDIAGTAEIDEEPKGVLVKTLVELALN